MSVLARIWEIRGPVFQANESVLQASKTQTVQAQQVTSKRSVGNKKRLSTKDNPN